MVFHSLVQTKHLASPLLVSLLVCAASLVASQAAAEPSKLKPEVGYNYGEQETGRTAAMGGAARAVGYDIHGLFLNPANIAASSVYHLGAIAQIHPEARRQSYGAGAVDSVTSRLAAGIGGFYTIQDPEGLKRKLTDFRLALAVPISEKFLVGLTGKYLKVRQDGLGVFGQSYASGGLKDDSIVSDFTFDAGATVRPTDTLSIAIMGTNLTNPGHGFLPTSVSGGLAFGNEDFTLEADGLVDFTTYASEKIRVMGGGEYLAGHHFPIRLGYRYDQGIATHFVSGGLGYIDQSVGIELAIRRSVVGESTTAVILGFQYFLESSGVTKSAQHTTW
jgi:hypothetical protein